MHGWDGGFHRAQRRKIGIAGIVRMDAALHADFRGAPRPSFAGAAGDLLGIEVIGRSAQVCRRLALGKCAKRAMV